MVTDKEIILNLRAENALLSQKIKSLEEKVELLLNLLQKQDVKRNAVLKDSHNSSLPPSSAFFSNNKSLRPTSTRPTGGQVGHQVTTLELWHTPD